MSLPKVLLVDDDPAVRRFVAAVLEDLDVDLHPTSRIADALPALQGRRFALVLTDLMLAGESGASLVAHLRDHPALGGGPKVAVLSAGLNAEVEAELRLAGAWRLLHKPVTVAQLRQCVCDALEAAPAPHAAAPPPAPAGVIDTYFGGNERIYRTYRQACEEQFPLDLAQGDRALAERDAVAMRRLGHTLKTVLLSLGHAEASATARALDTASLGQQWAAVAVLWPDLRAELERLIAAGQDWPPG